MTQDQLYRQSRETLINIIRDKDLRIQELQRKLAVAERLAYQIQQLNEKSHGGKS